MVFIAIQSGSGSEPYCDPDWILLEHPELLITKTTAVNNANGFITPKNNSMTSETKSASNHSKSVIKPPAALPPLAAFSFENR